MRLIGLCGYKQSGKDTVASTLKHLGYTRAAFADTLKSMALAVDPLVSISEYDPLAGVDGADVFRLSEVVERDGWETAKTYPEVRRFLQRLGTEGVRDHLGPDTWVNALFRRLDPEGSYVITDVRFPNEATAIWNKGGAIWKVHRPGYEGDGHASEKGVGLILPNKVIYNDGSLVQLEQQVRAIAA